MRLVRACVILMSVALLAAASGCTHEQRDWHSAQAANTIEAYEQFITAHPKSARAADAQVRISQLTEERDWQRASTTDTADAYRQFLALHPQAKFAPEARIRIENFGLSGTAAPPAPGGAPPSTAAPATAVALPPAQPAAASEAAENENAGSYAVQLGAFTSKAKAQAQWHRVSARFAAELRGTVPDIRQGKSTKGHHVYRLQAKPLTEARARSVCAALLKKAQACVVVRPRD
jgi:cell division septation protein DedD